LKEKLLYEDDVLQQILSALKNPENPLKTIEQMQGEIKKLRKENEHLRREKAAMLFQNIGEKAKEINGVKFIAEKVELGPAEIKNLIFSNFGKADDYVILLATEDKEKQKAGLTLFISKNLIDKYGLDAGAIIREIAKKIHGGGGGQKFFASAGGKNPGGIPGALEKAEEIIREKVKG